MKITITRQITEVTAAVTATAETGAAVVTTAVSTIAVDVVTMSAIDVTTIAETTIAEITITESTTVVTFKHADRKRYDLLGAKISITKHRRVACSCYAPTVL